ncbi:hypothetical protein PHSY_005861 [Pseudozyma hubeiensis SY62]|uniref:Uncharacterized protein n=1 Tax=Pseudozyma hubeiensis (strain SY62) TaxID=1305764 RepID=R9PA96_PSEHS|nr:hypothetical protein PHSY_005861 [Pseudozyma hubeiensis SY62]GAC98269.1 hypothetical protein PHSY_005861 [Pseudozyma hubeiensis SY62]
MLDRMAEEQNSKANSSGPKFATADALSLEHSSSQPIGKFELAAAAFRQNRAGSRRVLLLLLLLLLR